MKWPYILTSIAFVFSTSCIAAELTADIPKGDPEFVTKVMTGAPAEIVKDATIVRIGDGFKLTTIKNGQNGWTCAIDPDGTPFCTDAAGLEWYRAISTQAAPP